MGESCEHSIANVTMVVTKSYTNKANNIPKVVQSDLFMSCMSSMPIFR